MADRDERIAELTKRLDDGYARIGEATAKLIEVPNWEKVWVDLLREYERLNDERLAHHAEAAQVEMALDVPVQRVELEVA